MYQTYGLGLATQFVYIYIYIFIYIYIYHLCLEQVLIFCWHASIDILFFVQKFELNKNKISGISKVRKNGRIRTKICNVTVLLVILEGLPWFDL